MKRSANPSGSARPPIKPRFNIAEFVRQVQSEAIRKVTWPGRQEVLLGTVMVFVLATVAAIFFLLVDQFFGWGLRLLLS